MKDFSRRDLHDAAVRRAQHAYHRYTQTIGQDAANARLIAHLTRTHPDTIRDACEVLAPKETL